MSLVGATAGCEQAATAGVPASLEASLAGGTAAGRKIGGMTHGRPIGRYERGCALEYGHLCPPPACAFQLGGKPLASGSGRSHRLLPCRGKTSGSGAHAGLAAGSTAGRASCVVGGEVCSAHGASRILFEREDPPAETPAPQPCLEPLGAAHRERMSRERPHVLPRGIGHGYDGHLCDTVVPAHDAPASRSRSALWKPSRARLCRTVSRLSSSSMATWSSSVLSRWR